jgi:acyl carrier protein
MSTQAKIRSFLEKLLNDKGDSLGFTDQQLLVTEGRLSSLDVMHIVLFLEENYGIDFSDRPFDQNEFDSVESITALVDTVTK